MPFNSSNRYCIPLKLTLSASITLIFVPYIRAGNACFVQEVRFSKHTGARIMTTNGTSFSQSKMAASRNNDSTRRKSRPRPIMVTLPVLSVQSTCSNTSQIKLKYALFSLLDSQNPTACRRAIKLLPARQRIIIVRYSDMSWNTLLNLDKSIVSLA